MGQDFARAPLWQRPSRGGIDSLCISKEGHVHLHNVFFTLKDSSREKQEALVQGCLRYLKQTPGVVVFSVGTRSEACVRDVNDLGFHVALTVLFENQEAHDRYQKAENHNRFVEVFKDNWAGARVFDSAVQV